MADLVLVRHSDPSALAFVPVVVLQQEPLLDYPQASNSLSGEHYYFHSVSLDGPPLVHQSLFLLVLLAPSVLEWDSIREHSIARGSVAFVVAAAGAVVAHPVVVAAAAGVPEWGNQL